MDWLKLIYENLGAKAPTASIFIVTLLGAIIFGGGWWLLGKQYEKDLLKQPKPVMEGGPRVAIRPLGNEPDRMPPARHVSESQIDSVRRALIPFPTLRIGIVTLKNKPERIEYANELANSFRQAGWTVVRLDIDSFDYDQPGTLLIRHTQENTPDLKPLVTALLAAQVPYRVVDVGSPINARIYTEGVDTSMPVIFVGPRAERPQGLYKDF